MCFFPAPSVEPRASCRLGNCSAFWLHPWPTTPLPSSSLSIFVALTKLKTSFCYLTAILICILLSVPFMYSLVAQISCFWRTHSRLTPHVAEWGRSQQTPRVISRWQRKFDNTMISYCCCHILATMNVSVSENVSSTYVQFRTMPIVTTASIWPSYFPYHLKSPC